MSERTLERKLVFPLSVLRVTDGTWDVALTIGQVLLGRHLSNERETLAEDTFAAFAERHDQTPEHVWEKLSPTDRFYAIGMGATGWFFSSGLFCPLSSKYEQHLTPNQPTILLPIAKLQEWREKKGDENLRRAICAVRSIIGSKEFARVSVPMVAARMLGFVKPSVATSNLPSRQQVRTLLDKMGSEVSRVYAGGKFTWMSTKLDTSELLPAVIGYKRKKNLISIPRGSLRPTATMPPTTPSPLANQEPTTSQPQ